MKNGLYLVFMDKIPTKRLFEIDRLSHDNDDGEEEDDGDDDDENVNGDYEDDDHHQEGSPSSEIVKFNLASLEGRLPLSWESMTSTTTKTTTVTTTMTTIWRQH